MKLPSKAAVFWSPNNCYKPNHSDCEYIKHYEGVCAMGCMCRGLSTPSISLKQVSFYLNLTNKLMNDCFGCVFLDLPAVHHNTKGLHEHPGRKPRANKNRSMYISHIYTVPAAQKIYTIPTVSRWAPKIIVSNSVSNRMWNFVPISPSVCLLIMLQWSVTIMFID